VTAETQRAWESKHTYSLNKYNLTEERIRKDLAFASDTYDA
jgi:hypothetical protein